MKGRINIEPKNVKAVENSMGILEAIAEEPQSFSELISLMNSNKATIHRLITTLENLGYIYKNQYEKYQLTLKICSLGENEMKRNDLLEKARPFLSELVALVNETVVISTFINDTVYYLDKIEWNSALRIVVKPGQTAPLYCVASGKLYLSHFNDEALNHYLDHHPLEPFTENTITSRTALKKEIKKIQQLGFAIDNEEWEEYLRGVAFPIYDFSNEMIAALSISGVSYRFSDEKIHSLVGEISEIAKKISRLLGYVEEENNNMKKRGLNNEK